jgi:hypothetical protein
MSTPGHASKVWAALLSDLDELRDRYIVALEKTTTVPDRDGDVADAIGSTLEILSGVARVARTRLEARSLVHTALADLLRGELAARIHAPNETADASR